MSHTLDVLDYVADERGRQDERWGTQEHDDGTWALILGEEVGEAFQQALEGRKDPRDARRSALLREELVQVAAVAVNWIEAIDRRFE